MPAFPRDIYRPGVTFSEETILSYARDIASAAGHLHGLGIAHGDLYAHNTLVSQRSALVSDFGAACVYGESKAFPGEAIERIEARAFGILLSELLERVSVGCNEKLIGALKALSRRCMGKEVMLRPGFERIERELRSGLFFSTKRAEREKRGREVLIPSLFSPLSLFYVIPAAYFLNKESREGKEGGRL